MMLNCQTGSFAITSQQDRQDIINIELCSLIKPYIDENYNVKSQLPLYYLEDSNMWQINAHYLQVDLQDSMMSYSLAAKYMNILSPINRNVLITDKDEYRFQIEIPAKFIFQDGMIEGSKLIFSHDLEVLNRVCQIANTNFIRMPSKLERWLYICIKYQNLIIAIQSIAVLFCLSNIIISILYLGGNRQGIKHI